jgi:PAS domain S-box-containing protein
VHPDDQEVFKSLSNDDLNHSAPRLIHFRIVSKSGEIVHIEQISQPVYDENGMFIGIRGTNIDITERISYERKIAESEKRFREIFEKLPVISVQGYNDRLQAIYWNDASEIVYGYSAPEAIGRRLDDLIKSDDSSDDFMVNITNAFKNNSPIPSRELRLKVKDGLTIIVYSNQFILTNLYGERELYFVSVDLSELKEKEERLILSEERYRSIIAISNTGAWEYDMVKDHLWISNEFLTMLGYSEIDDDFDELKSNSYDLWLHLLHPEDRDKARAKFELFLAGDRRGLYENYFRLKHKLGHDVWVWSRAKNLIDENGELTDFTLGTHIDISELKNIEINLKKSNEELEQFAYIASHDLQEPLRMVTNFLTLLERKYGDSLDEKAKKYIYYAVDGAVRMRQIILDLLEYSRVGRFTKPKVDININSLIDEIKSFHTDLIEKRNAEIICIDLPTVHADYTPLYQVFNNLISNALKYQEKGNQTKITIGVKDDGDMYEFYVSDNGIGIAPEFHERIFILFQRLHTKDEHEGNGLGLAVTRKIVENWGGTIWLKSAEGQGTTFYFTLPKWAPNSFEQTEE